MHIRILNKIVNRGTEANNNNELSQTKQRYNAKIGVQWYWTITCINTISYSTPTPYL